MRLIRIVLFILGVLVALWATVNGAQAQETEAASALPSVGLSVAEIEAYTMPEFERLTIDPKLLHDRSYRRVHGELVIYDAPNGNVTRTIPEGFNFVTTQGTEGDWTLVNPGEWVRSEQLTNANGIVSNFTGVFLPEEPLEYTIGWLLVNAYASDYPGGPSLETNELFNRYREVTLYSTYEVDGWRWYQVGPDQWIEQRNIGKFIAVDRPEEVTTDRWISLDLYEQVLVAYEGNTPIFATLLASGLPRWETVEGTFPIYYRKTRELMSLGTPGDDFYYLEEVPWTMYYDEGRAIHGAYWHDGLGFRRSHGCVNLSITDAYWLYQWVAEVMETQASRDWEEGPMVHVYASDAYK